MAISRPRPLPAYRITHTSSGAPPPSAVQGVHVAANAVDQEIDVTVHGGMVRALAVAVAVAARVDVDVVPVRAGD